MVTGKERKKRTRHYIQFILEIVIPHHSGTNVVWHKETHFPMLRLISRYNNLIGLLILVNCSHVIQAQTCDDDSSSFLDLLFDGLGNSSDNENLTYAIGAYNRDPRPRSEQFEFKYGISTLISTNPDIEQFVPVGFEMALFASVSKKKKVYIGGSFSFHNYGYSRYDSTFGPYDNIVTNHEIIGFSLKTKYRFIDTEQFLATIGVGTGLMTFYAKSHAKRESCSCDGGVEKKRLKILSSTKGSFDVTLGIQVPLPSFFDKISLDISYQSPGITEYIRNDDVRIEPASIHYEPTVNKLQFVNILLGLSHYF